MTVTELYIWMIFASRLYELLILTEIKADKCDLIEQIRSDPDFRFIILSENKAS
jgi:hypothetical protein